LADWRAHREKALELMRAENLEKRGRIEVDRVTNHASEARAGVFPRVNKPCAGTLVAELSGGSKHEWAEPIRTHTFFCRGDLTT
jgi:hypothetical protein